MDHTSAHTATFHSPDAIGPAASGPLSVHEACTLTSFDALRDDWQALLAQVPSALPFQGFAWNRCWWQHLAPVSRHLRQERFCVLAVRDAHGQLVGVWPLFCTRVGWPNVAQIHWWRPFGADPNLTELRVPLVLPSHAPSVYAALHRHVRGWLSLTSLMHEQLPQALHEALAMADGGTVRHGIVTPLRVLPNFIVDLAPDWPTMKKGLKRNIKESIRRCYNSLARDGLAAELAVHSERAQVLARLPRFYGLHRQRAKAPGTPLHPNYFERSPARQFIAALVKQTHGDAGIRLFELRVNGQPVAMRLGFVTQHELYLYYSGYDLDYGAYSVMTTLVVEAMQWAIAQGLRTVNLSVGEDVSKTRWSPRCVTITEALVTAPGWRGELLRRHVASRISERIAARRVPIPLKGRARAQAEREADTPVIPHTPASHDSAAS